MTQSEGGDGVRGVDLMISEDASLVVQQIATNLVSYCRVAMTIGGEFVGEFCASKLLARLWSYCSLFNVRRGGRVVKAMDC